MEKLGINALQLAAQLINVAIIFVVFKKIVYKPLLSMLAKRKQIITDNIKLQSDLDEKLVKLTEKEKELMKKAKSNAAKMAGEAKKEIDKSADKILGKARTEAKKIVENAKLTATAQSQKSQKEIEAQIEQKALLMANRIIGELLPRDIRVKINEAQVRKLIKGA